MTNATCRPSLNSVPLQEREQRPDHLGDLLESLADLLIEVGQQRAAVARLAQEVGTVRTRGARASRLARGSDQGDRVEAASIHQVLQHEQLI